LDRLCGVVDAQLSPTRGLEEASVEGGGCVGGVHDLGRCSPALGGTLLEQPEAVAVTVVEVAQPGLLHRGSDRCHQAVFGDLHPFADSHDGGGVRDLFSRVAGETGGRRAGDVAVNDSAINSAGAGQSGHSIRDEHDEQDHCDSCGKSDFRQR
jgi:hypothetical protein